MLPLFYEMIFDYTVRNVVLGALILGVTAGALGSFAFLRKQSLLGDSISHSALPGVALAFLLTGSKTPIVLLFGAAAAGWLGTFLILSIIRKTRIDVDGAQGIVLSVFFGLGLMLLTFIQKMPTASQAGLDKFLFGQAAALLAEDIITMAVLGSVTLIVLVIFWKEIKLMTFDPDFAVSMGYSRRFIDLLITTMIVLAIVIGLQTVGVILMSAMIVAPAASARQWTDRLGGMVLLSSIFGAASGIIGALLSAGIDKLPTGPSIVIVLTLVTVFSIFFSPHRGILSKMIRMIRNRKNFAVEGLLVDLYKLALFHHNHNHMHSVETIRAIRPKEENIRRGLEALRISGYADSDPKSRWFLTANGIERAKMILKGE